MLGYVEIPSILEKIVSEHQTDQYIQVKGYIMNLLNSYRFERLLLRMANDLSLLDTFNLGQNYYKKLIIGITPKDGNHCAKCQNLLQHKQ